MRSRASRVAAMVVAAIGLAGCSRTVRPQVVAGVDACARCNMVIDQLNQACGYASGGEFVTFDSPQCLVDSYESVRKQGGAVPTALYFADYRDAKLYPADEVTFLLTDHIPTVMNAGVISFGSRAAAESATEHDDETLTDWAGLRTARGDPDIAVEVSFAGSGMSPEFVEVAKGELVQWRASGLGLDSDLEIAIQGYPELGTITVPATGDDVVFRLLALRPGAGFPIVDAATGSALGRLKVTGAHTADEEEM